MRQSLNIIDDGGSRSGKSRHRLEEGVGIVWDISADGERECSEEAEKRPSQRDEQIGVTAVHTVFRHAALVFQHKARPHDDGNGYGKRHGIVFSIKQSHGETQRHQQCLKEEELSQYLIYKLEIQHFFIWFIFYDYNIPLDW